MSHNGLRVPVEGLVGGRLEDNLGVLKAVWNSHHILLVLNILGCGRGAGSFLLPGLESPEVFLDHSLRVLLVVHVGDVRLDVDHYRVDQLLVEQQVVANLKIMVFMGRRSRLSHILCLMCLDLIVRVGSSLFTVFER